MSACPCFARQRWVSFPELPDKNMQKTFNEDPLTDSSSRMTNGPAFACLLYCQGLVPEVSKIKTPFLTMHVKEDTFTDYESSVILMKSAATTDKTHLIPPPGSHHALFADSCSREWAR